MPAPSAEDKPYFRFYPGAYDQDGPFKPSNATCAACERSCIWRYDGNIYGPPATDNMDLCARCVAAGRLNEYLDGASYGLHDVMFDSAVDAALEEELMQRTPGVASYNPFDWPVIGGVPLAFIGYGDNKDLWNIPEIRTAMTETWKKLTDDPLNGPTSYLLVFKQIDGAAYRAAIDLD